MLWSFVKIEAKWQRQRWAAKWKSGYSSIKQDESKTKGYVRETVACMKIKLEFYQSLPNSSFASEQKKIDRRPRTSRPDHKATRYQSRALCSILTKSQEKPATTQSIKCFSPLLPSFYKLQLFKLHKAFLQAQRSKRKVVLILAFHRTGGGHSFCRSTNKEWKMAKSQIKFSHLAQLIC